MYSPLNEDYMFQEMSDRVARVSAQRWRTGARSTRRWWRKAARVAR